MYALQEKYINELFTLGLGKKLVGFISHIFFTSNFQLDNIELLPYLDELNFEIKKLNAEIKHLTQDLDDLKALSKMWVNPLTIYSKEIILKNGSTVFGKIM